MEKVNQKVQRILATIGGTCLLLMLLVAVADIVSRLLGYSFSGAYEMIGWLSAMAVGCSLGYTQMYKGHVTIDFVNNLGSGKLKLLIKLTMLIVSFGVTFLIGLQLIKYALLLYKVGSLSETLMWPIYPWVFLLSCGFFAFSLSFLAEAWAAWLQSGQGAKMKSLTSHRFQILQKKERIS